MTGSLPRLPSAMDRASWFRPLVMAVGAWLDAVVPRGSDVDHVTDLQLGGADDILNMNPLEMSVNRSLGAQIGNQIRGLEPGTRICSASICSR